MKIMDNKVKIFTATHKEAKLYGDNSYIFLNVGADLHPNTNISNAINDNANSDNISDRNDIYCELTGLYYVWKHCNDMDIKGLVHYRRFLANKQFAINPNSTILKSEEIETLLNTHDIILPTLSKKDGARGGYFTIKESIPEFCIYRLVRPSIEKLHPEYLNEFEREFTLEKMVYANIMICKKELFNEYCEWLFDILFDVEKNLQESPFGIAPREMGYISEYLLNVWVRHKHLKIAYKPMLFIERNDFFRDKIRIFLQGIGLRSIVAMAEKIYIKIKK